MSELVPPPGMRAVPLAEPDDALTRHLAESIRADEARFEARVRAIVRAELDEFARRVGLVQEFRVASEEERERLLGGSGR